MSDLDYLIGDSRNITKMLDENKSKSPDLIITSPPYYDTKNYENKKKQIGFGQNFSEYKNDIINIFQQCYEFSSKNSTFWLIMGNIRRNGELVPLPEPV